jgi:lysophospholipase L1-like esterase
MNKIRLNVLALIAVVACLAIVPALAAPDSQTPPNPNAAGSQKKVEVLLLGDSTVEGSVTRDLEPDADQLEDVVRKLLDAEGDLPPIRVVNQGRGGEYVQGLLEKRYADIVDDITKADFVTIRYGLNDYGKRENFKDRFTQDLVDLITRIRKDRPEAEIYLETLAVYFDEAKSAEVNPMILAAAKETGVPVIDIYARMQSEIAKGNTCLMYHRVPLDSIPAKYHALLPAPRKDGQIVVMDNRLDVHVRDVPRWFSDKHPNLAGYHIIGDEEAKFLAPRIREKFALKPASGQRGK